MNILHVISNMDPTSGGVAAAAIGLTKAQREIGINASMMSSYPPGQSGVVAQDLRQLGIDVRTVGPCPGRINRHPLIRPTLEAAMRNIDVVHIHGLWEEVLHCAAVIARRQQIPYLVTPHGMLDPYSLKRSRWIKQFLLTLRVRRNLNFAKALHYTSDAEKQLATPLNLRPMSITEPNGIDFFEFINLPVRGAFRDRLGISATRPVILFLSRLHPKKGLDLLIPAFARFIGNLKQDLIPKLVIGGPDANGYRATLEQMVARLNISDSVVFSGMLHGVERVQAYVDSDLFALPSYQENFGIVVAEAMACATPVLISDQVNIWPVVKTNTLGQVCHTTIDDIHAHLQDWYMDREQWRAAAQKSPEFVRSNYGWGQIAHRWIENYKLVMKAN